MKSDFTFFLVLLGLGGVAWYLYSHKTTTVITPPPQPSTCDQLLGAAGSAVSTSQGAPMKINAPTGLCSALANAGNSVVEGITGYRFGSPKTLTGITVNSKLTGAKYTPGAPNVMGGGGFVGKSAGATYTPGAPMVTGGGSFRGKSV